MKYKVKTFTPDQLERIVHLSQEQYLALDAKVQKDMANTVLAQLNREQKALEKEAIMKKFVDMRADVQQALDNLHEMEKDVRDDFVKTFNDIKSMAGAAAQMTGKTIAAKAQAVAQPVINFYQKSCDALTTLHEGIKALPGKVADFAKEKKDALVSTLTSAYESAKGHVTGFIDKVKNNVTKAFIAVKDATITFAADRIGNLADTAAKFQKLATDKAEACLTAVENYQSNSNVQAVLEKMNQTNEFVNSTRQANAEILKQGVFSLEAKLAEVGSKVSRFNASLMDSGYRMGMQAHAVIEALNGKVDKYQTRARHLDTLKEKLDNLQAKMMGAVTKTEAAPKEATGMQELDFEDLDRE